MAEKPILFSAPMVRAILAGRKTQTRRVVKPAPKVLSQGAGHTAVLHEPCRYGKPGDRLWVRETHSIEHQVEHDQDPPHKDGRPVLRSDDYGWRQAHYRASDPPPDLTCENGRCRACRDGDFGPHWRPSIHMPRWACRLVLDITDVRMERLQDISEEDALAEGINRISHGREGFYYHHENTEQDPHNFSFASDAFRALWVSINGRESWDADPWVWVVSFKRAETT